MLKVVNVNHHLFLQSVLGALIAINLKNTLLQLSDPYYLWKKSKLDCVSQIHYSLSDQDMPRTLRLSVNSDVDTQTLSNLLL